MYLTITTLFQRSINAIKMHFTQTKMQPRKTYRCPCADTIIIEASLILGNHELFSLNFNAIARNFSSEMSVRFYSKTKILSGGGEFYLCIQVA